MASVGAGSKRKVAVPRRLWICGGSSVADAAALLSQARVARAALASAGVVAASWANGASAEQ